MKIANSNINETILDSIREESVMSLNIQNEKHEILKLHRKKKSIIVDTNKTQNPGVRRAQEISVSYCGRHQFGCLKEWYIIPASRGVYKQWDTMRDAGLDRSSY